MSMHDMEAFTEVAVSCVADSGIPAQEKRDLIHTLFQLQYKNVPEEISRYIAFADNKLDKLGQTDYNLFADSLAKAFGEKAPADVEPVKIEITVDKKTVTCSSDIKVYCKMPKTEHPIPVDISL